MDAMTFTATQLQARGPGPDLPHAVRGRSHAEDLRVLLEEFGAQSARVLGERLDLPPGRIGALLKWDLKIGRVMFHDGLYELAPDWQPASKACSLRPGQEVITWYSPAERMPDADMLVLMRMPDDYTEPVTVGFTDGVVWFDRDCMTVDRPVRWADMPTGGQQ